MTSAGGTVTALVGTVLLRLTLSGTYKRYVRVGMGPWLAIAGVALVVLGLTVLVRALRHDDGDHHGLERVGWLLLAPIAVLVLVAPPTLGSFGVDRTSAVDVTQGVSAFAMLPPSDEPRPMTLLEFGQRAYDRDGASFRGVPVALTGFVVDADDGGFRLARYEIACCAADAVAAVVRVVGVAGGSPARDQWVTVVGTVQPGTADPPTLAATSIEAISAPEDPYE